MGGVGGRFPETYNDPKNYTGTSEGLCHVISYLFFFFKKAKTCVVPVKFQK